jgi:hypothetical protein
VNDDQAFHEVPDTEDVVDSTGKILNQQQLYGKMISDKILLPHGGDMQLGKVIGRTLGDHGSTMGCYDDDPVFNSMIYDVDFPDGTINEFAKGGASGVGIPHLRTPQEISQH